MSVYLESKHNPAVDMDAVTYSRFMGRWTHVGSNRGEMLAAIRQDLTKSIAGILPLIQDEARYAFAHELDGALPPPGDVDTDDRGGWRPFPLYVTLLRMVALLSGRVFVGLPLNRSEAWVDASINYTPALVAVMHDSTRFHPLLIPFVAPFLPSVRRVRTYLARAQLWMRPLVAEVLAHEKSSQQKRDPEKDAAAMDRYGRAATAATPVKVGVRGTLISWLLKYLPDEDKTPERIGIDQMIVRDALLCSIYGFCF